MLHEVPTTPESLENPKDVYSKTIKDKITELYEQGLVTEGYMHSIFESADIVEGPFKDVEDAQKLAEHFIEVCIMPITKLCERFNQAEIALAAQVGNISLTIDEFVHNQDIDQERKDKIIATLTDLLNDINKTIARIQEDRTRVC
jgi:hypothetical protein